MKMNIQFDYRMLCKSVLQEKLNELELEYKLNDLSEIEFSKNLSESQLDQLTKTLNSYGIDILLDSDTILVQHIKNAVIELIKDQEKYRKYNVSDYLAKKLNYSYAHLSSIFSEVTHSSIENFIILQKIDVAKELIIQQNLTLTEIAYRLNYSSVAHLSTQFKKTTGLTPSRFLKIIKNRKK